MSVKTLLNLLEIAHPLLLPRALPVQNLDTSATASSAQDSQYER